MHYITKILLGILMILMLVFGSLVPNNSQERTESQRPIIDSNSTMQQLMFIEIIK